MDPVDTIARPTTSDQLYFINYCKTNNLEKVFECIGSGRVLLDYRHPMNGWTALHFASDAGHVHVAHILLLSGFEVDAVGFSGERPCDLIEEDCPELADLFRTPPKEWQMPENAGSPRPSFRHGSISSDGYTPPFSSRVPSLSQSTSFDFGSSSSATPPSPSYSYGRRDSLSRTRFLLIRTSHGKGKETFTRVTLPGGSTLSQMHRLIEKATRLGRVKAVFTLPEKIPIVEDEQILQFGDCQKIDVHFTGSPEPAAAPPPPRVAALPEFLNNNAPHDKSVMSDRESLPKDELITIPVTVEEDPPHPDIEVPSNVEEKSAEVKEEEKEEEKKEEEEEKDDEEKPESDLKPLNFPRESVKSEPSENGGFEEVFADETEEKHDETRDVSPTDVSPKEEEPVLPNNQPIPTVKLTKDPSVNPVVSFIEQNPDIVRNVAVLSLLTSAFCLGYFVVKKYR